MFYSNKSSILVSGEGNSSRSKMTSFMRILNLQRILFLMCIVASGEINWGTKEDEATWKEKIEVENLKGVNLTLTDHSYNVVFLGNTQVGKTQIINRHNEKNFENQYISTIGVDSTSHCYKSTINKDNIQTIQLQIWDISGNETHRSFVLSPVKNADAIVLVYDVTKKESFEHIGNWLKWATENNSACKNYFLVGNKADLEDKRQVEKEEAKKYAEDNKMRFFEVSAKKNTNIDELFKDIVKECLEKDKDIIKAIEEYETKNKTNDDSHTKVDNTENNFPQQDTKHTNNKRCSCCPCNK